MCLLVFIHTCSPDSAPKHNFPPSLIAFEVWNVTPSSVLQGSGRFGFCPKEVNKLFSSSIKKNCRPARYHCRKYQTSVENVREWDDFFKDYNLSFRHFEVRIIFSPCAGHVLAPNQECQTLVSSDNGFKKKKERLLAHTGAVMGSYRLSCVVFNKFSNVPST